MFVLHAWRWCIVIRSLFDIVQIMRAYIMQLRIALGMNIDSYSGLWNKKVHVLIIGVSSFHGEVYISRIRRIIDWDKISVYVLEVSNIQRCP